MDNPLYGVYSTPDLFLLPSVSLWRFRERNEPILVNWNVALSRSLSNGLQSPWWMTDQLDGCILGNAIHTKKKKKKTKLARTTNRSDFRLIVSPRSIRLPCPRNLIWSLLITYRLNLLSGEGWWWRLRGCNREREMRVLVLLMNEVLSCLVGCSL